MRRAYRVSIDDAHVGRADDIRRRRRMRIDAFRCFKEAENVAARNVWQVRNFLARFRDAETHRLIRFEPLKRCIATNYGTTRCLRLASMDVDATKMLNSAVRRNTLMNAFGKGMQENGCTCQAQTPRFDDCCRLNLVENVSRRITGRVVDFAVALLTIDDERVCC